MGGASGGASVRLPPRAPAPRPAAGGGAGGRAPADDSGRRPRPAATARRPPLPRAAPPTPRRPAPGGGGTPAPARSPPAPSSRVACALPTMLASEASRRHVTRGGEGGGGGAGAPPPAPGGGGGGGGGGSTTAGGLLLPQEVGWSGIGRAHAWCRGCGRRCCRRGVASGGCRQRTTASCLPAQKRPPHGVHVGHTLGALDTRPDNGGLYISRTVGIMFTSTKHVVKGALAGTCTVLELCTALCKYRARQARQSTCSACHSCPSHDRLRTMAPLGRHRIG